MLLKYFFGICSILVLALTGCGSQETKNSPSKTSQAEFHVEKWSGDLSDQDKLLIKALHQSINSVEKIMVGLEAALQEMEQQDEFHEAEEVMNQAKEDVLFHWNRMHNDYHTVTPNLEKIKDYYEGLLIQYREGLSLELKGMETGDPTKMKWGYQKTEKTIVELKRFKRELEEAFTSLKG